MISSKPLLSLQRRRVLASGALLGLGSYFIPSRLLAQPDSSLLTRLQPADKAEVSSIIADFLQGQEPLEQGLTLQMPVLGDNPAAVPLKIIFNETIDEHNYCKNLIVLAEGNPRPIACRFEFSALSGSTEVAIRLRLIDSQYITVMSRMSDDRVLLARQHITVTAGACGM